MPPDPVPTLEFSEGQALAFDLVGTVSLPGPYPSTGDILLIRYPGPADPRAKDRHPRYYLKIVQQLSQTHTVTRFVAIPDIRMVRIVEDAEAASAEWTGDGPNWLSHATVVRPGEIRDLIASLKWDPKAENVAYEVRLPQGTRGIVYVPENAPVLTRHESLISAATSAEGSFTAARGCAKEKKSQALSACPRDP
ncbi:hypothetical protein OJF2_20160 [Aquisphaera giovannonii]|uniref:Uncharacterized protein n=1 Tax=Aquisphaera giovannonii TaxID=406548 RepID=A0A5B9VZY3_9BACT|nr:hypothetical protein [Aquisphaera giovannonii]QEH33514.1 hypothetical protein OJF2_20160 [Aquisphaera giovannonii]